MSNKTSGTQVIVHNHMYFTPNIFIEYKAHRDLSCTNLETKSKRKRFRVFKHP